MARLTLNWVQIQGDKIKEKEDVTKISIFQHGLSAEICSENSVEGRVQCEQAKERASGKILNISTFHYEEEIKRLVLLVD